MDVLEFLNIKASTVQPNSSWVISSEGITVVLIGTVTGLVLVTAMLIWHARINKARQLLSKLLERKSAMLHNLKRTAPSRGSRLLRNSSIQFEDSPFAAQHLEGVFANSKNGFYVLSNLRAKQDSIVARRGLALVIRIPDTQLQIIINSKRNNKHPNSAMLTRYSKVQRHDLEGDFEATFEIYIPYGTGAEALSLLSPDVMHYLLENLASCDIEVNGNTMYIFYYESLMFDQLLGLLSVIDGFMEEVKLRFNDVRPELITSQAVARTATDPETARRELRPDLFTVFRQGLITFHDLFSTSLSTWWHRFAKILHIKADILLIVVSTGVVIAISALISYASDTRNPILLFAGILPAVLIIGTGFSLLLSWLFVLVSDTKRSFFRFLAEVIFCFIVPALAVPITLLWKDNQAATALRLLAILWLIAWIIIRTIIWIVRSTTKTRYLGK